MINKTILIGRITKDPEIKRTQTGMSVCSFTLAVNRNYKQDGQPEADFIQCVAWDKKADLLGQYVNKGALLGIEGRTQTRNYDTQNGKVYVTEIVVDNLQFLEKKEEEKPKPKNTYDIRNDNLPF